jgi:Cdc6-like AAA superfamily ATPase
MRPSVGLSEFEARNFLENQLSAMESTTFYWESEEAEDLVRLIVDLMARLIEENNKAIQDDLSRWR